MPEQDDKKQSEQNKKSASEQVNQKKNPKKSRRKPRPNKSKASAPQQQQKQQPKPKPQAPKRKTQPSAAPPQAGKQQPKGPVGWDQLKEAIKKDHEQTKDGTPPPIPQSPAEEVKEPTKQTPEVEEKKPETEAVETEAPEPEPTPEPAPEPTPEPAPEPEPVLEKPEITEPVSVPEPGPEGLSSADDAEKKEIIRIITKYAIGGCVVIAIIAGVFLFKLPQRIIGFVQDIGGDEPVQERVVEEEPAEQESSEEVVEQTEEGVGTAILTGEDIPTIKRASSSIQASYATGLPEPVEARQDIISSYMATLSRLQNSFRTDIHQLLDASSNRANVLRIHLSELNVAFEEAQDDYDELSTTRDELKEQFNEVTTRKDELEENFFTAIENLRGIESNEILIRFIEASKNQVEIKAEFNALTKLKGMYETALSNMDSRIKDIEANRRALIEGVKVVDIEGSNIDLIIEEGAL